LCLIVCRYECYTYLWYNSYELFPHFCYKMRITKLMKRQVSCNAEYLSPTPTICSVRMSPRRSPGRRHRLTRSPRPPVSVNTANWLSHIILYCPRSRPLWNTLPHPKIHHHQHKKFVETRHSFLRQYNWLLQFFLSSFLSTPPYSTTTWTPTSATTQVFHISVTR